MLLLLLVKRTEPVLLLLRWSRRHIHQGRLLLLHDIGPVPSMHDVLLLLLHQDHVSHLHHGLLVRLLLRSRALRVVVVVHGGRRAAVMMGLVLKDGGKSRHEKR